MEPSHNASPHRHQQLGPKGVLFQSVSRGETDFPAPAVQSGLVQQDVVEVLGLGAVAAPLVRMGAWALLLVEPIPRTGGISG